MIETSLQKRRSLYKGEMGLFADTQMAEDDLALITEGDTVFGRFYSVRNLDGLRRLWAIVDLAAQNSDRWLDKTEAMDDLKMRAGFTRIVYNDKKKELEVRPKSLTRVNNENLKVLTEKIENIILTEVLPGMKRNELRRRLEEILNIRRQA